MELQTIVAETALELSMLDYTAGSRLKEDYGLDSLALTQLIVRLEEKLNMEIDIGLLMDINMQTVEDVCEIIQKSLES